MILSVYDYRKKMFDYFEVPGTYDRSTRYRALTQKPQGSRELGGIGYAPEALGVPLPPGARQVGTGKEARGMVAFDPRGPSRVEVASADVGALGGLGASEDVVVQSMATPFVQVVAAACVASIVGVLVQRALRKSERKSR